MSHYKSRRRYLPHWQSSNETPSASLARLLAYQPWNGDRIPGWKKHRIIRASIQQRKFVYAVRSGSLSSGPTGRTS